MNPDLVVGVTGAALSCGILARWGWQEWRNRHTGPDPEGVETTAPAVPAAAPEPQTRAMSCIDVEYGPVQFSLLANHPIQPADVEGVHRFVCRVHGPVVAALVTSRLIAAVAEREAEQIDADLADLLGGAS